jgi:hypothetical protein
MGWMHQRNEACLPTKFVQCLESAIIHFEHDLRCRKELRLDSQGQLSNGDICDDGREQGLEKRAPKHHSLA